METTQLRAAYKIIRSINVFVGLTIVSVTMKNETIKGIIYTLVAEPTEGPQDACTVARNNVQEIVNKKQHIQQHIDIGTSKE